MSNQTLDFDAEEWSVLLENSVQNRSDWIRFTFLFLMFITFLVGIAGNLLTCIVIYCDRSMHTATNYYLFNLAVSDLMVALGILLEISGYMNNDLIGNGTGEIICKVHFFLVVALWNNGIWIMTALAIERYIAIWHPLKLNSKPVWKRVMKIISFIWTMAILETVPEIWTLTLIKTSSITTCFIVPTTFARWLNGSLGLLNFIIPLGIMVFVYVMIALKVNVTLENNPKDKIFNHGNHRRKVNKLIVALTMSFLGCWLPFFSMRLIIFATDLRTWPWYIKNWDLLLMVSSFNGWFSIVLNPMLFSLMSTKFRKALKMMWNRKFKNPAPKSHINSTV